jgi:DNA-binding transcriptional LysR family regulator
MPNPHTGMPPGPQRVGSGAVLHLLETFCAVAEAGSLNRAAARLHRTQPAITRQLRTLERELGAILLRRTSQGVTLTPAGAAVLPHARQALAAVRACQQAAAGVAASETQRLSISAGLIVALYVLPPVVSRFRELHPQVTIDLRPAHHAEAVRALLGYEVELAVIASPVESPQLRAAAVLTDPLLLVGPPPVAGEGQAAPGAVRLAALEGATLLVLPRDTGLCEQIEQALARAGVSCRLSHFPTAETIKSAVALGMGLTILPCSAVREEMERGRLVGQEIEDWPEARRVRAMRRAEGRTSAAASAFLALLRDHYQGER